MTLIIVLLVGLIAGWLASQIVQGTGYGLVGDIVIGVIGSLIAGWIFPLGLGIGGYIGPIIMATIGAVFLLVIVRLVRNGGKW